MLSWEGYDYNLQKVLMLSWKSGQVYGSAFRYMFLHSFMMRQRQHRAPVHHHHHQQQQHHRHDHHQ